MLETVAPGLHRWLDLEGERRPSGSGWAVETRSGLVLVDPVEAPFEVLQAIERLGPPVEILLTSASHLRATGAIARRFGCPVACHAAERPLVEREIDRTLEDGDRIGEEIRVLSLPGRTPGEAAFHLERDGGSLIVGPALVGDPPGEVRLPPIEEIDDPDRLGRSLQRLVQLAFERLLPSAGETIPVAAKSILVKYLDALETPR